MNHKIKLLIVFNHIISIVGFLYGNPWMLVASLISYLILSKLGGEIGLHRYFTHRSFKTTKFWHYTMLLLSGLLCFGPPMAWVGVHRKHHAVSDTDEDPHGKQPAWRIWLTMWKPFIIEVKYIKDMLRDKEQKLMYNYYFWYVGLVWLSLFLINWQLPVFLISIPSLLAFHSSGLVNTVCHLSGERLYETNDTSYNNKWVNLITLGSGLHNTHHAFPSGCDNRRSKWDIDVSAVIIKHVLIVK